MASKPIPSGDQSLDPTFSPTHPDLSASRYRQSANGSVNVFYGDASTGNTMSLPSTSAQDDYSPNPSPRALSQFTSSSLPHSPVEPDSYASGADEFGSTYRHHTKQEVNVLEPLPRDDNDVDDLEPSPLDFGTTRNPNHQTPTKKASPTGANKTRRMGSGTRDGAKNSATGHASDRTNRFSWVNGILGKIGLTQVGLPKNSLSSSLGNGSSNGNGTESATVVRHGDTQKHRSHRSTFKQSKWLFVVMALVAVASGGLGASLALMMNSKPFQKPLTAQEAAVFNQEGSMTAGGAGLPSLTRPVNILVMGTIMLTSDLPGAPAQTKDRYLEQLDNNLNGMSDAMLLIRFDPETRRVSVLSIPRDTRVAIQGVGTTKINFANYSGGAALAAQTVSRTLGDITIDRYVRLNVSGFGKLIDTLGGVDVYVPKLMKYQDDSQHLYISLKAGQQRLNGARAIQYMRYRHDDLGDIGRVQRQQSFFRALIEQKMKPDTILKTPEIMSVLKENIDTNLSVEEILALGYFITQVQRQDVKMLMLPGRFANPGEFDTLSYWVFDQRLTRKLLDRHFGVPLPPRKDDSTAEAAPPVMRIAVQDSYAQPEGVKRATVRLSKSGYEQVFPAPEQPWHRPIPKTQIIAQGGDREAAEKVREALGLGEVLVESTGILESDVTVRIGQDWLRANNLPTKPPAPGATTANRNKTNTTKP